LNENIESASSSENIYQARNNHPQPATRINEYGQQRLLPSAQFRTNNNNLTKNSSSYGTFDSGYPSKPATAFGGYGNTWTTLGPQIQTQVVPSQKSMEQILELYTKGGGVTEKFFRFFHFFHFVRLFSFFSTISLYSSSFFLL
jgi:hypothetical protein